MKHPRGLMMLASAALVLLIASSPVLAKDAKTEPLYPNATRSEPKLDLKSAKDQKTLQEGLDAVAAQDFAKAEQLLQPLVDSSSKYAQSLALQGLANAKYTQKDLKGAISLLQRSLAIGVLPNDTYFQLQYELAQFQLADEQYQAAVDTLTKWRAEGKKETAQSYALEGNADYRLGKYPEAIAAINKAKTLTDKPDATWDQILMASYAETGQNDKAAQIAQTQMSANPDDPNALNNAASVLMQAHKYPEAIALLEKAHAAGNFKSESNYVSLAKLYLITGQESDDPTPNAIKAQQLLNEGISKGMVKSSAENYVLLGQSAEMANQTSNAIDAYQKAMPLAKDGEAALRAGRLQLSEGNFSQSKSLAQQAIDKGVTQTGTAYMILAESERGLKNKPAAIAAMQKAAQDPKTSAKANAWLKKAGAG